MAEHAANAGYVNDWSASLVPRSKGLAILPWHAMRLMNLDVSEKKAMK
jgi:hypothetical protein